MGALRPAGDGILIAALLARSTEGLPVRARAGLERLWGPPGAATEPESFTCTRYDEREMGEGLFRQFVSFVEPFRPAALREAKLHSNGFEWTLSEGGRRSVNVDPGCMEAAKLTVASTNDATYLVSLGGASSRNPCYTTNTAVTGPGRGPIPTTARKAPSPSLTG